MIKDFTGKPVSVGDTIFFARKEGHTSVRRYLAQVTAITPKYVKVKFPPIKCDGYCSTIEEDVLVKTDFIIVAQ